MRHPNENTLQDMFGELEALRHFAAIVVEFGGELTDTASNEKNRLIRQFFKAGHSLNWTDSDITKLLLAEVL